MEDIQVLKEKIKQAQEILKKDGYKLALNEDQQVQLYREWHYSSALLYSFALYLYKKWSIPVDYDVEYTMTFNILINPYKDSYCRCLSSSLNESQELKDYIDHLVTIQKQLNDLKICGKTTMINRIVEESIEEDPYLQWDIKNSFEKHY